MRGPGTRSILLPLLMAVLACAGAVRAESGGISHGPNSIAYSVSGVTFGALKESDGWEGHSRYWSYEGGAIEGGTLTLSGSATTTCADGAWLRGFLFVNSPTQGASKREINQSESSPTTFQFSESLAIPADADHVQVNISLTATTSAMEPIQEVSLLADAKREEPDWTTVDDSRASSGSTADPSAGTSGTASSGVPPSSEGADSSDGSLAVGALLGIGALAALAALAAAALAIAAVAAARRKKKAGPPSSPDAPVGYILRLNATRFAVTLQQPAVMQVAAYRVSAAGAYAPAPEARLQVISPPAAQCLQVAPAVGQGTLLCHLTLTQPPTTKEVGLVVSGTAGGRQVQQPVTVELRLDLELEFF